MSDALVSDPSHTAIATPKQSTMSEKTSVGVGRLFSMKTDPTAATTGMEALQRCGKGVECQRRQMFNKNRSLQVFQLLLALDTGSNAATSGMESPCTSGKCEDSTLRRSGGVGAYHIPMTKR